MGKTSIEWTDASWNPIVGCTEISPGCANCYAARLAATRLRNTPQYKGLTQMIPYCDEHKIPLDDGRCPRCRDSNGNTFVLDMQSIYLGESSRWTGEVRFLPERLEEPLHWKKPRRIFVCDMGDLFHESVEPGNIMAVWAIMAECRAKGINHTFQVLTKRAQRMKEFLSTPGLIERFKHFHDGAWPLPNVWLGVSVENQHFADERIPLLLQTPAAVRWISAEPLLGPVSLVRAGLGPWLHWVVVGGESGPHARPMHPDWARSLRDQCLAAGVPFFFKQWGQWSPNGQIRETLPRGQRFVSGRVGELTCDRVGKKRAGRLLDGMEHNAFPL